MTVAGDILAVIVAAGHYATTPTRNIFEGKQLPSDGIVPVAAAFVEVRPGGSRTPLMGLNSNVDPINGQLVCRGNPGDPDTPRAKTLSCRASLHRATISGYIDCQVDPEPTDLGVNDQEQPRFSINFRLRRQAAN